MVMDWCYQSTLKMMQVMNLKQARNFARKMTDYLQERRNEDLGISKASLTLNRVDRYIPGLDMLEVTDVIDSTLDKIRNNIIDKAMEAENILKEYEGML